MCYSKWADWIVCNVSLVPNALNTLVRIKFTRWMLVRNMVNMTIYKISTGYL